VEFFHRTKHHGSKKRPHEEEDKCWDENQHQVKGMRWAIRKIGAQRWDKSFVYIEKTIKPNIGKSSAKVRLIIKIGRFDNTTFIDEASYERLVDLPFMTGEASGSVIHGNVMSGIMVIKVDGFRNSASKTKTMIK
ncbi:hypothetical protein Tco_1010428, partial [Tanacetum coccineum]